MESLVQLEKAAEVMYQTGAIGAVCVFLLIYTVWNQVMNTKERNSMRRELTEARKELVEVLKETNKIDADLASQIKQIAMRIDSCMRSR